MRSNLSFSRQLVVLAAVSLGAACADPAHVTRSWEAMGDTASAELVTVSEREAERAFGEIAESVEEIARLIDPDDAGSDLSRLNVEAAEGFHVIDDRNLYRLVLLGLDYARATRGAFDPTVGPLTRVYAERRAGRELPRASRLGIELSKVGWGKVIVAEEARAVRFREPGVSLDLGGVGKGFALDHAARAFARAGIRGGVLRIGGNTYAWGESPERLPWNVEVFDPRVRERVWLRVRETNRGIAVSSLERPDALAPDGRRRRTILDPATGETPTSDVQVAVAIADSAADADAMSTALLVSGSSRGGELLGRTRRVEAVLLVRSEGRSQLLVSASLQGRLEIGAELLAEVDGRVRYLLPPQAL